MTVYRITVEKFMAAVQEYWTNVYHVNAQGGADTVPITNAIVAAERKVLSTAAIVTKANITLPGAGSGSVLGANIYNQAGQIAWGGEGMPLFVTARVDFTVAGSRPSRKYIRAFLAEDGVSFTTLAASYLTILQTYANDIVAVAGICDVDGQPLVSGAPKNYPQMRQLRRGSKKKVTP